MSTSPTPTPQQIFDAAYWASLPLAVQACKGGNPTLAQQLALQGYTIDAPIMALGWDPYIVMSIRQADGLTWVPSALQPAIVMSPTSPAQSNPPYAPYDPNNPPPKSIRVSTNPADYPPLVPPAPPTPPATNLVGPLAFGTLYVGGPGAMANGKPTVTDGEQVEQDGVTYTAHVVNEPMGVVVTFTKN